MAAGPAMTREQMLQAIQVGFEILDTLVGQGIDLGATGDMGICNTTASSAITAALTQAPVALVTGHGPATDEAQLAHKVQVVERALARDTPAPRYPLDILRM